MKNEVDLLRSRGVKEGGWWEWRRAGRGLLRRGPPRSRLRSASTSLAIAGKCRPPPGYSLHISPRVHTSESAVRPSLCFRAHPGWLLAAAKGGKLEECAARELGAERNSVRVGTRAAAYFVGCWLVAVSSDISCAGFLTSGVQDIRQVSEWIDCACCELRKR